MAIITGGASGMGDEFAARGARAIVIAEPPLSHRHRSLISLSLFFGGWLRLLLWLLLVGWDLWIGVDVGYDVGFGSTLMWVSTWVLGRRWCGFRRGFWVGVDVGFDVGFGSALMWVLGRRCGCEIWDGWRLMKVATDDLDRWRLLLVFVWWNDELVALFVCLNRCWIGGFLAFGWSVMLQQWWLVAIVAWGLLFVCCWWLR